MQKFLCTKCRKIVERDMSSEIKELVDAVDIIQKHRRLSHRQIAFLIGVSPGTVSRWSRGLSFSARGESKVRLFEERDSCIQEGKSKSARRSA
jgi:transposase-like protein